MRYAPVFKSAPFLALAALGGFTVAASPAAAQPDYGPTVEELTVTPRLPPGVRPQSLSQVVGIADLDLRYDRDVREMQRRVRTAARRVCERLGESGGRETLSMPSCTDEAVRRAHGQENYAIAQARGGPYYAYARPPAYAPYAEDYAPPASAVVPDPDDPPDAR